jgi:hypothetical protein
MKKTLILFGGIFVASLGFIVWHADAPTKNPLTAVGSLSKDAYPLYPNLLWGSENPQTYEGLSGYEVTSTPLENITDISAITRPFETYYADLLLSKGWKEDISMSAGGPGSAVIGYTKGVDYIVLKYTSEFKIQKNNEPAQCPCEVTFSVFSGGR